MVTNDEKFTVVWPCDWSLVLPKHSKDLRFTIHALTKHDYLRLTECLKSARPFSHAASED